MGLEFPFTVSPEVAARALQIAHDEELIVEIVFIGDDHTDFSTIRFTNRSPYSITEDLIRATTPADDNVIQSWIINHPLAESGNGNPIYLVKISPNGITLDHLLAE